MTGKIHQHMTAVFAIVLGGLAAAALGTALNIQREIDPPVTVYETRLGAVNNRTITIEFRAERHRNCALVVMAQWRDQNGVIQSKVNTNRATLTPGEERWIALEIALPPGTRAGPYSIRSVGEYTCAGGAVFIVPTGWVEVDIK